MPHDIAMIDGKPAMMFVGEPPWHNLGTAFIEAPKQAAAVMEAAHLNWEVLKKPVYAYDGAMFCQIPGYCATVRADLWGQPGCEPFGLVGPDYRVLQNVEAFEFFDPIVATGRVQYETAGALGHGGRVWVLARVRDKIAIKKVDEIEPYLLLSNGHDGHAALQIRFTPVRVVCQNTLSWALAQGRDLLRSHHGQGMDRRLQVAQEAVETILQYYQNVAAHFDRFAGVSLNAERLGGYLHAVFPLPKRRVNQGDRSYADALARTNRLRTTAARLYETGRGNNEPKIRHTLWAAYNGVTEMVDHHLAYEDPWQRMESICFGLGEQTKRRAFDLALRFSKN